MVETLDTLEQLNNKVDPKEGDIIFVSEDNQARIYKDGQWQILEPNTNLNINLYELNQSMVSQLPVLDDFQMASAEKHTTQFVKDTGNKYYMLLCNELKYYTVFVIDNKKDVAEATVCEEAFNCLRHLGDFKSVSLTEDETALEIWMQIFADDTPHVFYLFGYDRGMVHCID